MSKVSKVIKGKQDWLYLKSCNSIEKHSKLNNNLNIEILNKYKYYYDKILFFVFPDKEIVCKDFLPHNICCEFRNELNMYKDFFKEKLFDLNSILKYDDYYKTDHHINNKGALKVYNLFLDIIQEKFKSSIINSKYSYQKIEVDSLTKLSRGIGDLTWKDNLGELKIDNTNDIFYKIIDQSNNTHDKNALNDPYDKNGLYLTHYQYTNSSFKILDYNFKDISKSKENVMIDWNMISKHILYKMNDKYIIDKRIVIFYDSFLVSTIQLYKDIFSEIYLVKNVFDSKIIEKISPDFIFIFQIERHLYI